MSTLGSTVVYPYDDLTYPPIEVGASIFVSVNRILMRAVEHFGLNLIPWKDDEGDDRMGIWDGSAFLFITRGGVGWWDQAKILWRYGFFGPKRTLEAVAELTKTIGNVYNSTWMRQRGPWDRVEELNERLGFDVMTGKTAREYLVDDLKTGVKWADEMVEGSTRVNVSVAKPSWRFCAMPTSRNTVISTHRISRISMHSSGWSRWPRRERHPCWEEIVRSFSHSSRRARRSSS
jgi:hypothetical protein